MFTLSRYEALIIEPAVARVVKPSMRCCGFKTTCESDIFFKCARSMPRDSIIRTYVHGICIASVAINNCLKTNVVK